MKPIRLFLRCAGAVGVAAFSHLAVAQGLNVTNGLQLWLHAGAGVTTGAGGAVTAWNDQSGAGNHAAQPDEAMAPTLVPNALNGQPVLRFDGGNDFLDVADSPSLSGTGDITSLFVLKFDDFATFRAVWGKTAGNAPAPTDIYAQPGSGVLTVFRGDGTVANARSVNSARPLRAATYLVVGFDVQGNTLTHYVNGQRNGSGTIATTVADTDQPLKIGTRGDLFTKFKGDLAELLIYDRALSTGELGVAFNYLQTKYNLLNLAPTVGLAAAPAGPNVPVGQLVTLTATPSDLDGTISRVEFFANGGLIGTAVSAPYVLRVRIDTSGTLRFSARATDDKDATGDSPTVTLTAGPASTPMLTATNGLQLWLKADAGTTTGGGDSVLEWADQSGQNNHATQPDPGTAPTLVPNTLNGKPVLRFDGNQFLDVADSDSLSIAGDITSFFVLSFDDFSTFRAVWGKTAGNLPAPTDLYAVPGSGIMRIYRGNGTGSSLGSVDSAAPMPATNFVIAGFDMAGTRLTHYLNGAANGSGTIAAGLADTDQPLKIGTRNDFVTKFKGDMAELLIFNRALAATERRTLEVYLAEKYGFPLLAVTNAAPTVALTSPAPGASYVAPAMVTVTATANDSDGAIARVEFAVNGVVAAIDTTAPYSVTLSFPAADEAQLTAVAVDNLGVRTVSAVVPISVTTVAMGPLPRPANLKLWLRADQGVTQAGGGVTRWEDQSGNLNHATQTTEAAAPQLASLSEGGPPALHFDGDDDFMTVAHSPSVAIAGDITSFFVVRFDDFATYRAVWAKTLNNVPRATDWYALPGSGVPRLYRGGSGEASVDGAALTAGEPLIAGFDMTGINARHFLNGAETGAGQINLAFADAGRPLFIGTRDDRVTRMKGDIAEIIIYNAALSNNDRNTVWRYLSGKYSIGVSLRPDLFIRRAGANIVVSWPVWSDFLLEATTTLSDPFWEDVNAQVTTANGFKSVTVSASGAMRFFRLRGPTPTLR